MDMLKSFDLKFQAETFQKIPAVWLFRWLFRVSGGALSTRTAR